MHIGFYMVMEHLIWGGEGKSLKDIAPIVFAPYSRNILFVYRLNGLC